MLKVQTIIDLLKKCYGPVIKITRSMGRDISAGGTQFIKSQNLRNQNFYSDYKFCCWTKFGELN